MLMTSGILNHWPWLLWKCERNFT